MNIEGEPSENIDRDLEIDLLIEEAEKDLETFTIDFKGKIDDTDPPIEDGDGGVREPVEPGPKINLGGAALALPDAE